ncbi:MAG: hypothetical protein JXR65_03915 [Bacteroidales bacterium]|nr:hypothetical protein [Bacteroidales bacterium]
MNSKKLTFIIALLIFSTGAFSQEATTNKVDWNGYTQASFTTNFNDVHSFAMRRMKLWLFKKPGNGNNWGFKVQTTITSLQDQKFFLQDVEAYYVHNNIRIDLGQFIPEYSLQRFQPDYIIPLTDRAPVINYLIPNGKLGVRDIGVQLRFTSKNKNFKTWIGLFNGNGIQTYKINNGGIMLTNKSQWNLIKNHVLIGYSFMFRKADQLSMMNILPNDVIFTGNDIRYNLFAKYSTPKFEIQAEYLYANLGGQVASGYYVLSTINLAKNQIAVSWNQYNDLINSTSDAPCVHLGYNYLMKGDKLKIMFDNGIQIENGGLKNYLATIQFQYFFK